MAGYRFGIGDGVLCNMGPDGWKSGRIVALDYREDGWPSEMIAPYQVILDEDHTLIYVPDDDDRCCREASEGEIRITKRMDALAPLPSGAPVDTDDMLNQEETLGCGGGNDQPGSPNYRTGDCYCCDSCPRNWSSVELYSEHYRCASRNKLRITRHEIHLGTVEVGTSVSSGAMDYTPSKQGFLQCPTLVRLPPGLRFYDDGHLEGIVGYDPHRDTVYEVRFVAVSTADWENTDVGIVRLEITFVVNGNQAPSDFDEDGFQYRQQRARATAERSIELLSEIWARWERNEIDNRETCDLMLAELNRLREHLEANPKLDRGRWWAQLGGFHMNVHKLLENTLFECELYLGHALTFDDDEVRYRAEMNLKGCYKKRLLEAARYMWIDAMKHMMSGEWKKASDLLRRASTKHDGWGWAVNHGDLWYTESLALLMDGAEKSLAEEGGAQDNAWLTEVTALLEKGASRANAGNAFGPDGHPWVSEISHALDEYRSLQGTGEDIEKWIIALRTRTLFWCAQVLSGAFPFPPRPRPRLEPAPDLVARLTESVSREHKADDRIGRELIM